MLLAGRGNVVMPPKVLWILLVVKFSLREIAILILFAGGGWLVLWIIAGGALRR